MALDISKTSYPQGTRWILLVAAIVVSPAWFIFQFYPKIYRDFGEIKLLAICLAIGVPIMILNVLFFTLHCVIKGYTKKFIESAEGQHLIHVSASFLTGITLYMPIVVNWIATTKKIPIGTIQLTILIQIGSCVYLLIWAIIERVWTRRKTKTKATN